MSWSCLVMKSLVSVLGFVGVRQGLPSEALITPALFSHPSTHPTGEKREKLAEESLESPSLPGRVGGGPGERGWGSEGRAGALPCGSEPASIPPEFRLALRDVGVEALAGVGALEELLLELAFDGEAALEGDLGAGLHGALDPADRLGRLVRRAELLGVLVDLAQEVVRLVDVVDDADAHRLLEVDQAAGDHEVDRQALAHAAGQALGAAGAREHAQGHLGEADLARALLGNQDVRRHGDLEAAAHRVPFERRDDQLGGLLQPVQGLVGVQAEVVLEVRVGRLQHVDVGAGAEELVPLALDHDHVGVLVEARLEDGVVELAHHLVGVGVGRGIVQGEIGHPVPYLVVDQGALLGRRLRDSGLSHMDLLSSGFAGFGLRAGSTRAGFAAYSPTRWERRPPGGWTMMVSSGRALSGGARSPLPAPGGRGPPARRVPPPPISPPSPPTLPPSLPRQRGDARRSPRRSTGDSPLRSAAAARWSGSAGSRRLRAEWAGTGPAQDDAPEVVDGDSPLEDRKGCTPQPPTAGKDPSSSRDLPSGWCPR